MAVSEDLVTIRDVVDAMAQAQPETAFLIGPETGNSVPFQKLREQSILLSNTLRDMGLERGDKVAFLMDNGLLTAQLFLGTMYGGFVAVPLNVRAGADAVVVHAGPLRREAGLCRRPIYWRLLRRSSWRRPPGHTGRSRERRRSHAGSCEWPAMVDATTSTAADDVALLMYSSGSTGKPKAAIHTHSSVLAHGRNSIEVASAYRRTIGHCWSCPLYHINAECVTLIPTLLSGGSVVVAHRFVVSKFWDWVDDLHITWSALVPTIISELVDWDDPGKDRQAAFARIRFLRSSSAPLSPTLHRQFLDKFNLPLLQAMGSTEGGNVFSNPVPPGKNKIGSPGLPWGFETRIVDRRGRGCAARGIGRSAASRSRL